MRAAGHPLLRPIALVVIIVMAAIAALGFHSIRKDIENLRTISRDNILWSATQMELEFLRFQRSLAFYVSSPTPEAREDVHERLDILWSRFTLFTEGRVGRLLRQYDDGHGTLRSVFDFLESVDQLIIDLRPEDADIVRALLPVMDELQSELRLYSLRVVRGDTAAASAVRERMLASSQLTAYIALAALVISMLSLFLIMRDNRRQREMAALSQQQAEAAESVNRAKSRLLTMMSHELRNPLNGILGPLALVTQSDIPTKQLRLIEKAEHSARAMLRMLSGLLDYGDLQDGRLVMREEAFRLDALADRVRAELQAGAAASARDVQVRVKHPSSRQFLGDVDRLTRIFFHLAEHILGADGEAAVGITFSHDGRDLVGEITSAEDERTVAWKLELLMGLAGDAGGAFATESLGPVVARGMLAAARGTLSLAHDRDGRRIVRVSVPARGIGLEKIRIHLQTRSLALETLYRAALRSERVEFVPFDGTSPADMMLVDSTSIGDDDLVRSLRTRFPAALLVSLGAPAAPGQFDEVVEPPGDIARLRESVFSRLAS